LNDGAYDENEMKWIMNDTWEIQRMIDKIAFAWMIYEVVHLLRSLFRGREVWNLYQKYIIVIAGSLPFERQQSLSLSRLSYALALTLSTVVKTFE